MTALIAFDHATLGYGRRVVLSDITFDIPAGDFLGLVGPNGAGKTTILRAILGSLAPLQGTVARAEGLRFGYVPQRDSVDYNFPLKVLDVVMMGRYDRIGLMRRPSREDRDRAYAALEHVGIADLAERSLSALSGGQKQRALIGRALVGNPNVLVLDEPTNGMDLVSTTQILGLVRELHERDKLTVLMVSHALNEVANYVDRIALVVERGFRIGRVSEIMTESTLTQMYGIPVDVDEMHGHRIVVARRGADIGVHRHASTILLFRESLYGALVIAIACSVLGVYVVLRRIVFVGAAIAQLSSAGIALALFLSGMGVTSGITGHPTAFALAFRLAGAMFFGLGGGHRAGVPPDATIGVTYAAAAAAGILLIAKAKSGEVHDIFLQGNILGITRADTLVLLAVSIPVLLVHTLFYKEFLFVSFDREMARTMGYRVTFWNLFLYFTLGLVIAFAMQFAGVILVFNFLVLPAVTGLLLAHSMRGIFAVAVLSAVVAAVVGFSLSVPFDLPSGPTIIAVSATLALLAWPTRLMQRRG